MSRKKEDLSKPYTPEEVLEKNLDWCQCGNLNLSMERLQVTANELVVARKLVSWAVEPKTVWLACWCSWDYDFHEEPRYAFKTQKAADAWVAKQSEGTYEHNRKRASRSGGGEGWSVMEVDFA